MAEVVFSQLGAELNIQDGGAHESEGMLENNPQASTEDLGSVSWISMALQIPLESGKCHAT